MAFRPATILGFSGFSFGPGMSAKATQWLNAKPIISVTTLNIRFMG
jgi:hypothetical protein